MNHSDTSPSFKFYSKNILKRKIANILLTNLSHLDPKGSGLQAFLKSVCRCFLETGKDMRIYIEGYRHRSMS
ncbi:unnamed protein product [marine sediment metagenome]|uniref:Uncharacterized protein n=1 Tax=marine sediment metagenome TaxID=412755 RepID=X1NLC0_9ZZZZ